LSAGRTDRIRDALAEAFAPTEILVKDQSHLHAGHAGAREGLGHFEVILVSDEFKGLPLLQRHRMVFDALGDMMRTDIHALTVKAYTSDERG